MNENKRKNQKFQRFNKVISAYYEHQQAIAINHELHEKIFNINEASIRVFAQNVSVV